MVALVSPARCSVGERLSGLRFVECWVVVASAVAAGFRELQSSMSSKGSSGDGSSGVRFQSDAVSMLGGPEPWQHGGGAERLLSR